MPMPVVTDHAGTIPAPPAEESDEQPDKYANQDHRPDDAGSGDEGFHESRRLAWRRHEPRHTFVDTVRQPREWSSDQQDRQRESQRHERPLREAANHAHE